jgi:Ca2+-binding RTX toxin-like protein
VGDSGRDRFYLEGQGSVDGGAGSDLVLLGSMPGRGISLDLATGVGRWRNQPARGTFGAIRVERLEGTSFADVIRGTGAAETLLGDHGADRIYGRGGADRLDGGFGRDLVDGGPGADHCNGERLVSCIGGFSGPFAY